MKMWKIGRVLAARIKHRPSLVACCCLLLLAVKAADTAHGQQLYWSQFGTVRQVGRVNLDGTNAQSSVQSGQPFGMETLDSSRQTFWIDGPSNSIRRARADFSNVATLVSDLGPLEHLNLAIDEAAGLIFWTNVRANSISRARLSDGVLVDTFAVPASFPDDLAVDPVHHKLYWVRQGGGAVFRANYDGSGITSLFSAGDSPFGGTGSGLDLDLSAGKIYLATSNLNSILRANLDGTGVETVLTLTHRPFGMELFEGRMYWADLDGGKLFSAKLNGSDLKTVLAGLTQPRQVSVMSAIPEPNCLSAAALVCLATISTARRRNRASAYSIVQ